jgi:hypothetical protein
MVRAERAEASFAKTLAVTEASARAEERALVATVAAAAAAAAPTAIAAATEKAALHRGEALSPPLGAAMTAAAAVAAAARPRADVGAQVRPEATEVSCSVDTLSAVLAESVNDLAAVRGALRDLQNAYDANEVVSESLRSQVVERDGQVRRS